MNAKKTWDLNGLAAMWSKRHLFVDQATSAEDADKVRKLTRCKTATGQFSIRIGRGGVGLSDWKWYHAQLYPL